MTDDIRLVGERIWLRPITREDAEALAMASHLEEEVAFTGARVPLSALSFEQWISTLGETEFVFAICWAGEETCIGTASLRCIDRVNGTGETGMGFFSVADRGRGLGTETKELLLRFAFEDVGLHAVSCTISAVNVRSARAVERQGYRFAGKLTARIQGYGGAFCDQLVYDLTREEWQARPRDWRG
jgi:RimJ/RimL family protein N-acetyltransferase